MPSSLSAKEPLAPEAKTAQVVEAIMQKAGRIATLPAVAVRFIHLCENPDTTIETLSKAMDPVLGVRILKLVNSAYYGLPRQVNSIKHAIMILGVNAVKNIAITTALVKLVRGGYVSSGFKVSDLWTHSIAVAAGARMLAQKSNLVSADEAFLAGMIHDIGIILEMQLCESQFNQVINELAADESLTFCMAEQDILGATHEDLGAGLCEAWRFPESLRLSTRFHHHPWDVEEEADRSLPALIHVADVMVARLGLGYTRTVETDSIDPELSDILHLSGGDLETIANELPEMMLESKRLLSDDN